MATIFLQMEIIAKIAGYFLVGLVMRLVKRFVSLVFKLALIGAGIVAFYLWLTHR